MNMNMTAKQIEVVATLKAYALANYNKGGHWIYETHGDADYLAKFDQFGTIAAAKADMKTEWELFTDISDDINAA